MTIPKDMTDALRKAGCDINPEDRVYKSGEVFVKVRTMHDHGSSGHGHEVFRVSGSIVDGETGKAIIRKDGRPAIHDQGEHLTVMNETRVKLVVEIERLRFRCVERTVIADEHYRASAGITGIGIMGSRHPAPRVRVTDNQGAPK